MKRYPAPAILILLAILLLSLNSTGFAMQADTKGEALYELKVNYPGVSTYQSGKRITSLWGITFGYGANPQATAENFRMNYSEIFGVAPADLKPHSLLPDQRHTQPVMYNRENDSYKFTLVYYSQYKEDIPVFRSELRLLVRNEANYPLTLARSALKDLKDFRVPSGATLNKGLAETAAKSFNPNLDYFEEPRLVIWAGANEEAAEPRLAMEIIGDNNRPATDDYEKWLLLVDALTGEILYSEDMILNVDVDGNVSGRATDNFAAEICDDEVSFGMPYSRVYIQGGNTSYADEFGDFTIPFGGSAPVDVYSHLRGSWFRVYNEAGAEAELDTTVTPPGPANFLHNSSNSNEYVRAQVNGYLHANVVRDFTLTYNPSYPGLQQTEFPVNVNINSSCNAYYDYQSINFYRSGGGCPNTAFGTVVHHEYGHHLVAMAGSGQGQYGEGMSDCMGVMITDDPGLAYGFLGNCNEPLRNADNNKQYPCSGGIHDCGQLLSGCVWDTRNALMANYPNTYMDILANLAVNAVLLHTGDLITPQITIDYLTLDDDNGNIYDGTPHYNEICSGFGAHNMDCPDLQLIAFDYPNGLPELFDPDGGTTIRVEVSGITGSPEPGTGIMYYNDGGGWEQQPMDVVSPNVYDAVFPTFECGLVIEYYFSAETTDGFVAYDPSGAPGTTYSGVAAHGMITVFEDDFSTDQGWTGLGGQGEWTIGPCMGGNGDDYYGGPDPSEDHSPTSDNRVLGNDMTAGDGDYEYYLGTTYWVTSPNIDCSGVYALQLSLWRWLGVERDWYDEAYFQAYNGSSWITLWENGSETIDEASWSEQNYDLTGIADDNPNFKIRFGIGPTDGSWQYCGWNIDDVQIVAYTCEPSADITVDMIPDNPPIEVQPGGYFTYTGILTNNTAQPQSSDVWVMLDVPGYGSYGPVQQFNNVPLGPNQTLSYEGARQNIPGFAPLGEYDYIAYCGDYPNSPVDSASFTFTVVQGIGGDADGWILNGWFNDDIETLPSRTELLGNFPNPFNPTTTFSYALADESNVSLEVYNLMGRKVATVFEGHQEAGYRTVQWNAGDYSSGVYFYKLTVDDQVFTKRMTLLK